MGRMDQSNTQKASGVTITTDFVISQPGTGPWPGDWGQLPQRTLPTSVRHCFGYRETRKNNVWKYWNIFSTCLEVEWFFLQ